MSHNIFDYIYFFRFYGVVDIGYWLGREVYQLLAEADTLLDEVHKRLAVHEGVHVWSYNLKL